jgi:NAD+ kinase
MNTNAAFHNPLLIARRPERDNTAQTLNALYAHLTGRPINLMVDQHTAEVMSPQPTTVVDINAIPPHCDLIIVVGGDGSILGAAHIGLPHQLPILGINLGRIGFLTDLHPDNLENISAILSGAYQAESRSLLSLTLTDGVTDHYEDQALNEIVLLPGNATQMIEFEIWINDAFVCSQRADGIITATPTGSTAYALSGGGPILHPGVPAILMVPMFPHTLSSRPIVLPDTAEVSIRLSPNNTHGAHLSVDGQRRIPINTGHEIHIKKHTETLQLIHPNDYYYFHTLRDKLGWETRQGQEKAPC